MSSRSWGKRSKAIMSEVGMTDDPKPETYTEAETARRAAATLKVMLTTPHKPHKAAKPKK